MLSSSFLSVNAQLRAAQDFSLSERAGGVGVVERRVEVEQGATVRWEQRGHPGTAAGPGGPAARVFRPSGEARAVERLCAPGGGVVQVRMAQPGQGSDKRKQSLYFPEDMLREIQEEATRQDRSLSWIVQQAWRSARAKIAKVPGMNDLGPSASA